MKTWILAVACVVAWGVGAAEPATRPAATQDVRFELDRLRREVAQLRIERDKLAAELAAAKAQLGTAIAVIEQPAGVANVTAQNWKESMKVGMTEAEADAVREQLNKVTASNVRRPVTKIMNEVASVTRTTKTVRWTYSVGGGPRGGGPPIDQTMCTITFQDGKVAAIEY